MGRTAACRVGAWRAFRSQSRGKDTGRLEMEDGGAAYASGGLLTGAEAGVCRPSQANTAAYFFPSTCLGIGPRLHPLGNRLLPIAGGSSIRGTTWPKPIG